jgi:lysophospholipase L1-like esterase
VRLYRTLDMSVFVMDYDHNAPDAEYLRKTHKPLFETVRKAHPNLPIIIISAPDVDLDLENKLERRRICYQTYLDARSGGDNNVFFIDGFKIFDGPHRDACTVDGCHPNDLGLSRMADAVIKVIDVIFAKIN